MTIDSALVRRRRGGGPARRAVVRWAWRLFRREWRQQALVIALLTGAVAATTVGMAVATNTLGDASTTFTLPGTDDALDSDIAAFREAFGEVDVISHQKIQVPGSVATIDLRAQATGGDPPTLRLLDGRYPSAPDEVAVTRDVLTTFDLTLGGTWTEGSRTLRVVGSVENPRDLDEQFALVPPGQADPPSTVTVVVEGTPDPGSFRVPSGTPLSVASRSAITTSTAAAVVLALSSIGLLFVGLVAVAGFTVMAQRRLRAIGMLGALGATDRHLRLVLLANGAVVGAVAAAVGGVVGIAGWLAFAPRMEIISNHRINRFNLPWLPIGAAMALAVGTAVLAAWWPARHASRIPVVAALSGRPPAPPPAHRFAASGGLLLVVGLGLLAFSDQTRPPAIVGGVVATSLGVLLLAPLTIRVLARAAAPAPAPVRLAMRDLARYQSRSGAALGAVVLAIGIAATIAVSATAALAGDADTGGNLPANELLAPTPSPAACSWPSGCWP